MDNCKVLVLIAETHRICDLWIKSNFIHGGRRPITVSAEGMEFDKLRGLRGHTMIWINIEPPGFIVTQAIGNNHIRVKF